VSVDVIRLNYICSIALFSLNGRGGDFVHLLCIYFSACRVGFVSGFA